MVTTVEGGLTPLESNFPGVRVPSELVAAARLGKAPPNRLLDEEVYERVGNSGTVAAEPAVLHFSGFEPGLVLTKVPCASPLNPAAPDLCVPSEPGCTRPVRPL
jgi:hypothetical protein